MFKWLRELVSPIHKKIEELIHCPYCLGHWITFGLLAVINKKQWLQILKAPDFFCYAFNFLFTAFAIMAIVALIHYVMLRAYEPVLKALLERRLDKLKKVN